VREIGPAPQVTASESGRNPGDFQTAVWDIVWPTETCRVFGRRPLGPVRLTILGQPIRLAARWIALVRRR
jgi:hypothetical protein